MTNLGFGVFVSFDRIFKNLSPDQLNLSALKGSCELHNLELNEPILMDLLSLPVWLNLVKANCNHAVIRVNMLNLINLEEYSLI